MKYLFNSHFKCFRLFDICLHSSLLTCEYIAYHSFISLFYLTGASCIDWNSLFSKVSCANVSVIVLILYYCEALFTNFAGLKCFNLGCCCCLWLIGCVFFVLLRFCGASLTATGTASLASALERCPDITEIKYVLSLSCTSLR